MDKFETRLGALEILFVKAGDWLGPKALDEMSRSIKADLAASGATEPDDPARVALRMIQAAHARIRPPQPDPRDVVER